MVELIYEITDEQRIAILKGLTQIFKTLTENNNSAIEAAEKLNDFTNSLESPEERAYCEMTIKMLLQRMVENNE